MTFFQFVLFKTFCYEQPKTMLMYSLMRIFVTFVAKQVKYVA
jgi:hypothetical protein